MDLHRTPNQKKTKAIIFSLIFGFILLAAGQAWASFSSLQTTRKPAPAVFQTIELANLPWQAKAGFDARLTGDLPSGAEGVITLTAPAFPIHLNQVFHTPPRSGLHQYMLGTTFELSMTRTPPHIALNLPELGENWAIYLNGQLLRNEIFLDPANEHILLRRSLQDQVISLPVSMLKPGPNHLVFHILGNAFQVSLFPGWAPGFPLTGGYEVALEVDLLRQQTQQNAFAMFQIGAYVFFGLYMLVFFVNRYQEIANFYLALFLLGFGAGWQLLNSPFIFTWHSDTSLITRLSYISTVFSGMLVPTIWFLLFPEGRAPGIIRFTIAYLGIVIFSMLVVPFEWLELFLRTYLIFMVLVIFIALWSLWKAWRERRPDVGKISILVLLGLFLAAWDLLDLQVLHTGWIVSPFIPLLFSGLFSVIIINRYWRLAGERDRMGLELSLHNQELEKAQEVLEKQVQQRTAELREEVKRREQMQEVAENRAIEAETLRQAGAAMIETLDRQEMVERILEQLRRVVPYDSASVQLKTADGNSSAVVGGSGFSNIQEIIGKQFPLDEKNPAAAVYRTHQPRLVEILPEENFLIFHPDFTILSWLCVPLLYRGETIGVLTLDSRIPNHFNLRNTDLVSAFAGPVALALHNSQVYEQVRLGVDELSMFYEIGLTITAGLDMTSLLEKLYDAACRLAPVDSFYVALVDAEAQQAVFPIFIDKGERKTMPAHPLKENHSMTVWVVKNKKTLDIPDTLNMPDHLDIHITRAGGIMSRSYVGVPLIARDQVLGVISLQSYEVNAYTPDHLRLFETLATQAVVAIENSRLFQQVHQELDLRQLAEKQLSQANLRLHTQISEIQELQENLREQAIRDSLTGLFNRRYMEETFSQELARAARENKGIGIIILDIDKFKTINDTYGHEAGDKILVALADILSKRLRSSDTACRYGGEEFLLLLPVSTLLYTCRRAEEMRKAVEEMIVPYNETQLKITISLGVAAFPDHGQEMDLLIRQADNNLYLAKKSGRNQVVG